MKDKKIFIVAMVLIIIYILVSEAEEKRKDREVRNLIDEAKEYRDCEIDSLQAEIDSLSLQVLSWENIDYWIEFYQIQHPEIVKQQIRLETGNLTSTICMENQNLFGMKLARVRETTAIGENRGHAVYSSFSQSIADYFLYQENMYSGGNYYTFLDKSNYAEAEHYISALKRL